MQTHRGYIVNTYLYTEMNCLTICVDRLVHTQDMIFAHATHNMVQQHGVHYYIEHIYKQTSQLQIIWLVNWFEDAIILKIPPSYHQQRACLLVCLPIVVSIIRCFDCSNSNRSNHSNCSDCFDEGNIAGSGCFIQPMLCLIFVYATNEKSAVNGSIWWHFCHAFTNCVLPIVWSW